MELTADTKDLKQFAANLKNASRSAYPLTVRATLDGLAFKTMKEARENLAAQFVLRNNFIQGSVQYQKSPPTFDINSMESKAGQVSSFKGKETKQLEKQEYGLPTVAKSKHGFVATPSARGGDYKKTVRLVSQFSKLNALKLSDIVVNPTNDPNKELAQAVGYAARNKKTINVVATSSGGKRGIYRVAPKGASLLYSLQPKKRAIRPRKWLAPSANAVAKDVDKIFVVEAQKRIEKELKKNLKG